MSKGKKRLLTLLDEAEWKFKCWRSQTINLLQELNEFIEKIELEKRNVCKYENTPADEGVPTGV